MDAMNEWRVYEMLREKRGRRLRGVVRYSRPGQPGAIPQKDELPVWVALEVNALAGVEMYGFLSLERIAAGVDDPLVLFDTNTLERSGSELLQVVPVGDHAEWGLPGEYRTSVRDTLSRFADLHPLAAGTGFRVGTAAHAFAGSNAFIFSRIAWNAAVMLNAPFTQHSAGFYDLMLNGMLKPLPGGG